MCYVPSKLLYLFTGNLDVILLNEQTEDKNWTKNCIKLALVHMHTTRLENLPNHTRDRRTFACSSSGHQHLDQVDSTRAKRARVQKIVDYLVTTTTAVVGLHNLSRKNWHFVKPLAFVKTFF